MKEEGGDHEIPCSRRRARDRGGAHAGRGGARAKPAVVGAARRPRGRTDEPARLGRPQAQGKTLKDTPPIGVNQGRKFNPKGDLVGPLTTSEKQNVLVLFVDFSDEPPGGPAQRLDLSYFDDMLFGTTYDPSAYQAG